MLRAHIGPEPPAQMIGAESNKNSTAPGHNHVASAVTTPRAAIKTWVMAMGGEKYT